MAEAQDSRSDFLGFALFFTLAAGFIAAGTIYQANDDAPEPPATVETAPVTVAPQAPVPEFSR